MINALTDFLGANRNWIAAATLVLFLVWETRAPFFDFFQQKPKQRAIHISRNFVIGALNTLLVIAIFTAPWLWATELSSDHQWGLLRLISLPSWLHAVSAILLFDIGTYWWHRINHVVPFLWRFHRVHHSDNAMDVTSATRFHVGEILLSSLLRIPLMILIGAELWHLALYLAILSPIVQFHHANIGLPAGLDRFLRLFIVTPNMHKVHHSRIQHETDSNYTSMLSIWDRLFGSFHIRNDPHAINLGLDDYDDPEKQTITGMLKTPLDK